MAHTVLDLYAGTGVGVAVRRLGAREYGVEHMPEAVETRRLNGMDTPYRDVWDAHRADDLTFDTLWASPPCQAWSVAGRGRAREHKPTLLRWLDAEAWCDIDTLRSMGRAHLGDADLAHVLVPMHYVHRFRPDYVAFEQVSTVIDLWRAHVPVLESLGYSVRAEVLNAEQYGVPQTRRRAILVARKLEIGEVRMPTPTHSRYYSNAPSRLDDGVLPWVSMADALGDAYPQGRPSPTVTGGGAR